MATRNTRSQTQTDPSEEGWDEVVTESLIKFDTFGDELIGVYTGWTETPTGIAQAHFDSDEHGQCFVNVGASLKQQLREAKKGVAYRIRYVEDLDTGQKSPMQVFKVWSKS